jgi:hypothetical protein
MRTHRFALHLALALGLGAGAAMAQDDQSILEESNRPPEGGTTNAPPPEEESSVTYSGIGLSRVQTEFENLEDAVNLDLAIGMRVPAVRWIGAEINLSFTIVPGENTGAPPGVAGAEGTCFIDNPPTPPGCTPEGQGAAATGTYTRSQNDLQMNNVGVFVVLRSPTKFYALGKYGYRYINSSIEEIQQGDDKSGTAYAVGGGWRWGEGLSGVEIAYTKYSDQIDYWGFNIAYGFGQRGNR